MPSLNDIRDAIARHREMSSMDAGQDRRAMGFGLMKLAQGMGQAGPGGGFKERLTTFNNSFAPAVEEYHARRGAMEAENSSILKFLQAQEAQRQAAEQKNALAHMKAMQDKEKFMAEQAYRRDKLAAGERDSLRKDKLGRDTLNASKKSTDMEKELMRLERMENDLEKLDKEERNEKDLAHKERMSQRTIWRAAADNLWGGDEGKGVKKANASVKNKYNKKREHLADRIMAQRMKLGLSEGVEEEHPTEFKGYGNVAFKNFSDEDLVRRLAEIEGN